MSDDENKLEMPFLAVLPYQILIDKSLPPGCKIHFAIICGLSKKFGYCYATDRQLAELEEVSINRIEEWNTILDRSGHITRKTINEHIPETKRNNPKQKFKKRRKIYINNAFVSKKDSETPKNQGSEEPPKNQGSEEPPKNQGYKKKPLSENLKQQKKSVVVPSKIKKKKKTMSIVTPPESLDKLDISEQERIMIAKKYPSHEIDLAVKRTLRWQSRESDIKGIMAALKNKDTWSDNLTKDETIESNKEFLKKFRNLDEKRFKGTRIVIGPTYMEFDCYPKNTTFKIDEPQFKRNCLDHLKKLGAIE
jgi:hypothetical protein